MIIRLCYAVFLFSRVFNAEQELHIHNNAAYFNDITHVIMQYKYRYMNSQNSVCYRIGITFVRSNTSSTHIKQQYTNVPVTVRKNKHRLACIWVKCGFLSAATSAFCTLKSADPHFTPGLLVEHEVKIFGEGMGVKRWVQ